MSCRHGIGYPDTCVLCVLGPLPAASQQQLLPKLPNGQLDAAFRRMAQLEALLEKYRDLARAGDDTAKALYRLLGPTYSDEQYADALYRWNTARAAVAQLEGKG